jgi:septation ring formation regulator EzrA
MTLYKITYNNQYHDYVIAESFNEAANKFYNQFSYTDRNDYTINAIELFSSKVIV